MALLQARFFSVACLSLLAVVPGDCQLLSFGVRGGVPLSDAYSAYNLGDGAISSHFNNRYTVGPTVEIHFPLHLSFEADVLYRHSRYKTTGSVLPGGSATTNDWQIPLLAKLDLSHGLVGPFIDGGLAYRHLSVNLDNPAGQLFLGVSNPNNAGVAIGGGVQFKLLLIRVSPEIRYTHWGQTAFSNAAVTSNNNQIDLLVGVTF
jgi:opacity protein-like surface antigen